MKASGVRAESLGQDEERTPSTTRSRLVRPVPPVTISESDHPIPIQEDSHLGQHAPAKVAVGNQHRKKTVQARGGLAESLSTVAIGEQARLFEVSREIDTRLTTSGCWEFIEEEMGRAGALLASFRETSSSMAPEVTAGQQLLGSSPPPETNIALHLRQESSDPNSVLRDPSSLVASAVPELEQTPLLDDANAVLAAVIPELEINQIWFLYYNVHLLVHPWFDVAANFERVYGVRREPDRLKEMWARVERREDVLKMCWGVVVGRKETQLAGGGIYGDIGVVSQKNRIGEDKRLKLQGMAECEKTEGKKVFRSESHDEVGKGTKGLNRQLDATLNAKSMVSIKGIPKDNVRDDLERNSTPSALIGFTLAPEPSQAAATTDELDGADFSVDSVLDSVGHHGYVAQLVAREKIESVDALLKVLRIEEEKLKARIQAADLTAACARPSGPTTPPSRLTQRQRAIWSDEYWRSEVERDERGRIQYNPSPGQWNFDDWKRLNGSLMGEDMRRQWQPFPRWWPH